MIVLGLTGSVGMGKSTTAQMFVDEGVPMFDADAAVHRLYAGEAVPLIEREFPGTTANGTVDREKLSAQVVGKPAMLNDSLTVIGTPRSGPRSPRALAASASRAAIRARSKSRTGTALMTPS